MKKEYIAPSAWELKIQTESLLTVLSGAVQSDGDVDDLSYGGRDEHGTMDPQ